MIRVNISRYEIPISLGKFLVPKEHLTLMPADDLDLHFQNSLIFRTGCPQLHDSIEPSQLEGTETEEKRGPWMGTAQYPHFFAGIEYINQKLENRSQCVLRTVIKIAFSVFAYPVLQSCFCRKESNSCFRSTVIIKEVTATSLDIYDYFTRTCPYEIIIVLCQLQFIDLICA